MTLEKDKPTLIGGNGGDLNGSPSPSILSPADWSATGGRRRTRKSRGKKRKGGYWTKMTSKIKTITKGGKGSRKTVKKGKKGKSRNSKSNRKK